MAVRTGCYGYVCIKTTMKLAIIVLLLEYVQILYYFVTAKRCIVQSVRNFMSKNLWKTVTSLSWNSPDSRVE